MERRPGELKMRDPAVAHERPEHVLGVRAVAHAQPEALRNGLARGLAPLYSPESSIEGVTQTIARINAIRPSIAFPGQVVPTR